VKTGVNGTESERWDHYPYGETWVPGVPGDQHRYTGHLRDAESENDYAGARYYANQRGRWLTVDPLLGDLRNPQSLNRYAYVNGDPVNRLDPDGRSGILFCMEVKAELSDRVLKQSVCRAELVNNPELGALPEFRSEFGSGGGNPGVPETLRMRFERCQREAFGEGVKSLGGKALPTFVASGLIREVSSTTGVDEVLLAATWAVESDFALFPANNLNERSGTVDIGPLQNNYQIWTTELWERRILGKSGFTLDEIFGTNVAGGEVFNGDPQANLAAVAQIYLDILRRKPEADSRKLFGQYNPNAATQRGAFFDAVSGSYQKFFDCLGRE
jgi:RHS repeat-associated protein